MAETIDIRELNERIERQSAFVTNLTTGMDPVSYTHLDVYKRQCLGSRSFQIGIETEKLYVADGYLSAEQRQYLELLSLIHI